MRKNTIFIHTSATPIVGGVGATIPAMRIRTATGEVVIRRKQRRTHVATRGVTRNTPWIAVEQPLVHKRCLMKVPTGSCDGFECSTALRVLFF